MQHALLGSPWPWPNVTFLNWPSQVTMNIFRSVVTRERRCLQISSLFALDRKLFSRKKGPSWLWWLRESLLWTWAKIWRHKRRKLSFFVPSFWSRAFDSLFPFVPIYHSSQAGRRTRVISGRPSASQAILKLPKAPRDDWRSLRPSQGYPGTTNNSSDRLRAIRLNESPSTWLNVPQPNWEPLKGEPQEGLPGLTGEWEPI